MFIRRACWRRSDEVQTDEHCTVSLDVTGLRLVGTVLGAHAGLPIRTEYRVLTDGSGATTAVHVRDYRGFSQRRLTLARDARGDWTVDRVAAPELRGCIDVDLGCSPSTNTLAIRRLRLGIGGAATLHAAWVRFPELTIEAAAQTYSRTGERTYRYSSGTFEAELAVDEDGVVTRYGPWERVGVASRPAAVPPPGGG